MFHRSPMQHQHQHQNPTSIAPTQIFPHSIAAMQNSFYSLPGIKFRPTDHQLISHYLRNKIFGSPFSLHPIIDCDLYGTQEPWEIWEFYKGQSKDDEDLYFFTTLKKKSTKSKQICRRVGSGSGCWKGENAPQKIQTDDDTTIGSTKRYRYEQEGSEHDGEWIMHEYSLLGHDEYVLCRIRKNDRPAKKRGLEKKRKSHEAELFYENLGSNKCFKVQNYQERVDSEAKAPVNDNDFTEDIAANSALVEAIFPGVTNDYECADLGDLFVDGEQVQSSCQVVDDGSRSKSETARDSSVDEEPPSNGSGDDLTTVFVELNDDEYYKELFPEDEEVVSDSMSLDEEPPSNGSGEDLKNDELNDDENNKELFPEDEEVVSDSMSLDKEPPSNGSGGDLKNDEFYKELFPEDEEEVQSSFQTTVDDDSVTKTETATNSSVDEDPPSNGSEDNLTTFFDGLDDYEFHKDLCPEGEEKVLLDSMSLADIGHLMSSMPLEIVQSF